MANLMDYLDWRGDLPFSRDPRNEVDNLLFSWLSYTSFDGIVPGWDGGEITLTGASDAFFEMHTEEELARDKSFVRLAPYMMRKMAQTERFGGLLLKNYVNHVALDMDDALQFSAVEIVLDARTSVLSFRGTDNHIVGWKEDFELGSGDVPAEREAEAYVRRAAAKSDRDLILTGHSKGGNLSVYAAVCCGEEIQDRILEVCNHDGPGFAQSFFAMPGLARMRPKIRRYVPESSVIGMLLDHVVEPTAYVKSSQKGVLQHDAMTWQILGKQFVCAPGLSRSGRLFDETMKSWLAGLDGEMRRQFVDELFSVLEATGANTLTQLTEGGLKNIRAMRARLETLQPETRKVAEEFLRIFLSHWTEMLSYMIRRKNGQETDDGTDDGT